MVVISKYGPVLDHAIKTAKELTQYGQAEVHVHLHPREDGLESAGLAVDLETVLVRLDPYIDTRILVDGGLISSITGPGKEDGVQRRVVPFIFERTNNFIMPRLDDFSSYPYSTIIDLENTENVPWEEKQVSITAARTPEPSSRRRPNHFIGALKRHGVGIPDERYLIRLGVEYQSLSPFPIGTFFQHFFLSGIFEKGHANTGGNYYPVSAKNVHELDYDSWDFFRSPAFWDSQSQYSSIALNKMAGARSYKQSAVIYSVNLEKILHHATSAERTMINLIQILIEGGTVSDIADIVQCPPKYRALYLNKILGTLRYFCNPDSLSNDKKKNLEALADAVSQNGFNVTIEELANLRKV